MAPQLRRLLQSSIKRHLVIASGLCIASVFIAEATLNQPRKARYAEFYKNYDVEKDFQRMVAAGVFQSVKP